MPSPHRLTKLVNETSSVCSVVVPQPRGLRFKLEHRKSSYRKTSDHQPTSTRPTTMMQRKRIRRRSRNQTLARPAAAGGRQTGYVLSTLRCSIRRTAEESRKAGKEFSRGQLCFLLPRFLPSLAESLHRRQIEPRLRHTEDRLPPLTPRWVFLPITNYRPFNFHAARSDARAHFNNGRPINAMLRAFKCRHHID